MITFNEEYCEEYSADTAFDVETISEEVRNFFDTWGYVVLRNVVPPHHCEAVIDAIWQFLDMDRDNLADCYRPPLKPGGMIEMYQHQALWNNRQYPKLYEAFAALLEVRDLAVTIDRVGMKLPQNLAHPEYDHKGFTHWDVDTSSLPIGFGVQGVLCLSDTDATMGGFQCIPGFHRDLEAWIAEQPADRNIFAPDLSRLPDGMKVTPIPARQGDLIIWNNLLAHGNGHNVSDRPRYSQYISMFPARDMRDVARQDRSAWFVARGGLSEAQRQHRIECWRNRLPPGGRIFPGDPREIEQKQQVTAELSSLGRKLLGLDAWE